VVRGRTRPANRPTRSPATPTSTSGATGIGRAPAVPRSVESETWRRRWWPRGAAAPSP